MEDSKAQPDSADLESSTATGEETPAKRRQLNLKGLLSRKLLVSIVLVSIVIHGAGMWYYLVVRAGAEPKSLETSLGEFRFFSDDGPATVVESAEFQLHVSLLPEVHRAARALLTTRRYRVQQDIEQLMRQASGGDFEEPTLSELKRQLREQINASLEMRAVNEVIITDLTLRFPPVAEESLTEAPDDEPFIGANDPLIEPAG